MIAISAFLQSRMIFISSLLRPESNGIHQQGHPLSMSRLRRKEWSLFATNIIAHVAIARSIQSHMLQLQTFYIARGLFAHEKIRSFTREKLRIVCLYVCIRIDAHLSFVHRLFVQSSFAHRSDIRQKKMHTVLMRKKSQTLYITLLEFILVSKVMFTIIVM